MLLLNYKTSKNDNTSKVMISVENDKKICYHSDDIHNIIRGLFMRRAFTLAEVLITLGIIGIVAAMTLPSLIAKHNEMAWLTAFKKSYSVLSQAYIRAYEENGVASTWCAEKNTECAKTYFDILVPYLNVTEVWGFDRPEVMYKISYRDLDGHDFGSNNCFTTNHYKFALNDGTIIGIQYETELNMPLLQLDTNGFRGPNQLGKDMFYFTLNSRANYPVISGFAKWWVNSNTCTTKVGSGWWSGGGCSLWIIATGNMDYLHRNLTVEEWSKAVENLLVDMHKDSLD